MFIFQNSSLKGKGEDMKYLFIDDNKEWLEYLQILLEMLFQNQNFVFAECHSTEEALCAISKHHPDVIFLDHHLTTTGNEGIEVVDQLRQEQGEKIKIYSTTSDESIVFEYQKRGIERISKDNLVSTLTKQLSTSSNPLPPSNHCP